MRSIEDLQAANRRAGPPICHPTRKYCAKGLCKQCYQKQWGSKTKPWLNDRFRLYGLTSGALLDLMASQRGLCAICREPPTQERGLLVDHDHQTNTVRALLCNNCNAGLGMFKDSPDRLASAITYLGQYSRQKPRRTDCDIKGELNA